MTNVLAMGGRPSKKSFTGLDFLVLVFTTVVTLFLLIGLVSSGFLAHAGSEINSLTDVFQTQSFRGGAEALAKANIIGVVLHYTISWFCFLGLVLVLYQKIITLLFLSSRNLWDRVYDIKTSKMKGGLLGYKEMFDTLFMKGENDNFGGGIDVIVTFLYSLLPNIKAYCDFNPDKLQVNNLTEEMGISNYMLKTSISTILTIFFLTIGYSGTLGKAYGVVVDGMAAAADRAVEYNLSAYVHRTLGSMGGYEMKLSTWGTEAGKYGNTVAEEMYRKILGECTGATDEFKTRLGMIIEASVIGKGAAGDSHSALVVAPENSVNGRDSILGGFRDPTTNLETIRDLAAATMAPGVDINSVITQDSDLSALRKPKVTWINAGSSPGNSGLVWSMEELILKALEGSEGAKVTLPTVKKYLHVTTEMTVNNRTSVLIVPEQEFDATGR